MPSIAKKEMSKQMREKLTKVKGDSTVYIIAQVGLGFSFSAFLPFVRRKIS